MPFVWIAVICVWSMLMPVSPAAEIHNSIERKGIEYARPNGIKLRLDARIPEGPGPFPAAIVVHGGAWVGGTRGFEVGPLLRPLRDAGFASFSISYRLARKPLGGSVIDSAKIADAISDVEQAIGFVRDHAEAFHIDPNRVALIGDSAGAQLSSMAAIHGQGRTAVKGVVALECPADLVSLSREPKILSGLFRGALTRVTWGRSASSSLRDVSPLQNIRPDMPPFLFIHGTADPVVPFAQSTRMCEAMQLAGATCEVLPVRGGLHGIRLWESFRKTAYKQAMIDWLARTL